MCVCDCIYSGYAGVDEIQNYVVYFSVAVV